MKECTQCHKKKRLTSFARKNQAKDKVASECKVCHRVMRRKYYLANQQQEYQRTLKRKAEIKAYLASKKQHCSQCGENHPATLQFHHIGQKDIDLARVATHGWSRERIDREIAKCIVLCANCHAKAHHRPNVPLVFNG